MFAYVRYEQDSQHAILPVSLIKDIKPQNATDYNKVLRVQAYWRGENDKDKGYYLAFVNEIAGK